ncbi:MAG: phospholipase D-like domain-containing protein, partial [Steroidobacteraceae bacterium]
LVLLAAWAATAAYHATKPLPDWVHVATPWTAVNPGDVRFLYDLTAADAYGRPIVEQQIFDRVLSIIARARRWIVLDYFLVSDELAAARQETTLRPLARQLEAALLRRKRELPQLRVVFITDPINQLYGAVPSPMFARLRVAGIQVVVTDLDPLRDSNPIYSGLWRLGIRWWSSDGSGTGWLPNPLDEGPPGVTFRAWARLLNLKANHRKLLIADDGGAGLRGVIASANPHAASSLHSNVALEIAGPALEPLLRNELAIAGVTDLADPRTGPSAGPDGVSADDFARGRRVRVQFLTEGAIRDALLLRIGAADRGTSVDVAMFDLSDRAIVEALLAAARREVRVRVLLDPNKDAFGHEKSGMPNRQVATELVGATDGAIKVRWYRTHGEQFHCKLVAVYGPDRAWITLGSANLTRRNIGDYNLEANVAVEAAPTTEVAHDALRWFETVWSNRAPAGIEYSAAYDLYADPSQGRYWLYRVMEATGLSSF